MSELLDSALAAFNLHGAACTLLQDLINRSYRVQKGDAFWYLRHYQATRRTSAELQSELLWLEAMADHGLPIPRPRCTETGAFLFSSGEDRVAVLSWREGSILKEGRTPEHYHSLGQLLGQVHQFSQGWSAPSDFVRPQVLLYSEELPDLPTALKVDLQRCREEYRAICMQLGRGPETYGLIHADPSFGNVLFHHDQVSLIDFDDGGYGYFLYDLAVVLAGAWGKPHYRKNYYALLSGYRSVYSATGCDEAVLLVLMAARTASLIIWAAEQSPTHPWIEGQWERLNEYRIALSQRVE